MEDLNTTSYAILSLLAVRPWTTYELAKQMDRSLRWYWPRAESVLYAEPKKLVAHGLAKATREHTGRRPRTLYAITAKGRSALRAWLDAPGAGPVLEFEALVKVAFADNGDKDQLLRTIEAIRADADAALAEALERAAEYRETGGPFPHRLHVIALTGKLLVEQRALLARWATWAHEAVAGWTGVSSTDDVTPPPDAFEATWVRTGRARRSPTGLAEGRARSGESDRRASDKTREVRDAAGDPGRVRRRQGRR